MKDCSGNSPSDAEYFRWFVPETGRRLSQAASALRELADGVTPFGSRSAEDALALLADVRRHADILRECATWFSGKPAIAGQFTAKLNEVKQAIESAESAYEKLRTWFK